MLDSVQVAAFRSVQIASGDSYKINLWSRRLGAIPLPLAMPRLGVGPLLRGRL